MNPEPSPRSEASPPTAPAPGRRHRLKLLEVFPTFGVGGSQVRFASLANALGDDFAHVVISMDGARAAADLVRRGVQLRVRAVPTRKGGGLSLANLRRFRGVLRAEQPDLLVTHNWGTIEWAMANRFSPLCPQLHIEEGFGAEEAHAQLTRRVWTRRFALARSTVLVPSRALHDLATSVWRLDPGQLRYIPNGIDATALCEQARQPLDLRRQPDERLFGTLAGLRPEKNLRRLVRIAALLPKGMRWRLIIAGDGGERGALERQAQDLGLTARVEFIGFVDRPGALLGALDLFVLTSDTEQMPISVLEAMAVGLPVLATDVGDLRIMLPPESADSCVLGRKEEAAFARRLAALLASPEECRRLGALNRARAKDFTLEAMVAGYDRLFRALIA